MKKFLSKPSNATNRQRETPSFFPNTVVYLTASHGVPDPINLRTYSARNPQLLRQIDVGTVCIQFDRPTRLLAAGT